MGSVTGPRNQAKQKDKISWRGSVTSVQPRIRLTRSYDQRYHTYLGYVLYLIGSIGEESREFSIAIGKGVQAKHQFRIGDQISGKGQEVLDPRQEIAEFYKISAIKLINRLEEDSPAPPPWHGVPPELPVYRERGHRRLAARTYEIKCASCIWGCKMPVEMTIDHWNQSDKRYRVETFCYGPLSCKNYRAGPTRKVPGRRGQTWEEEDWVDEQTISHREPDD